MFHSRLRASLSSLSIALLMSLTACGDDELLLEGGLGTNSTGASGSSPGGNATGSTGDTSLGTPSQGAPKGVEDDPPAVALYPLRVRVFLDGGAPGRVILKQGGVDRHYVTDEQGKAVIGVEMGLVGDVMIHASHPEARIGYQKITVEDPPEAIEIHLKRFSQTDNEKYIFRYPGVPEDELGCAHCHQKINKSWYESVHRKAAKNPFLHDVYAGVAGAVQSEEGCRDAGGRWMEGIKPGTEETMMRCYLGAGALPDLNPHCGNEKSCDQEATNFGLCADCHAPAINGKLGGRNLLEARGQAYDFGVQCDVCHKVESLNPKGEPGIGGYLKLLRPSEETNFVGYDYLPLYFGPWHDVSNAEMKSVQRDHFGKSEFCAGCHDYTQPVYENWGPIDQKRWPQGRLPIQSTFREWQESPFNPSAPCGSCHMPPYADTWNAATLEPVAGGVGAHGPHSNTPGRIAGWLRPPGSVRQHSWVGPRTPESKMLELAATVSVKKLPVQGGEFKAEVTVKNVGPGHALPTGLPWRALVLLVSAHCGDKELLPTGGNVVPEFAGALATKGPIEDWRHWPMAKVGQRIRVVKQNGWVDYRGPLRFGDGSFSAYEKGLPNYSFVVEAEVLAVSSDGTVTLDKKLDKASADYAILAEAVRAQAGPPLNLAGAPGFAFGRVLVDKNGTQNVPSFRANDISIDNRLRSRESFTTKHVFQATCAEPTVRALLLYRFFPPQLLRERQWKRDDVVMAEVIR